MDPKYILALEIGSSKIKGAVGTIDDGVLTVIAIEEEKITDGVRHGLIINVETVTTRALSIIRKLENRVSPRKVQSVYVGVGGLTFRASQRDIERQFPIEEEITAALITQLRKEALETALSDRDVMAVADGAFFIDHRPSQTPVGTYGRSLKATFNLITCRQQAQRNLTRAITDRLALKINSSIVRQIAQADLVLSSDEKRLGCMLVDLGAETTTVSIYTNGALCYMETLPMGSRNITRDLTALNILEERAEELKKAGGDAMPSSQRGKQVVDGIDFSEFNNYVNARATEIIANINEQIKYAHLSLSDIKGGIILVGGGAKLKGFNELLSKFTKLKVRSGLPSPTIHIADARISAYDSIDVISILAAASRLDNPQECLVSIIQQPVTPAPQPIPEPEPEPEPEVPESILNEEEEVKDEDITHKGGWRKPFGWKNGDKNPKETQKPHGGKQGFFTKIANRVEELLSEREEDDDDEYLSGSRR